MDYLKVSGEFIKDGISTTRSIVAAERDSEVIDDHEYETDLIAAIPSEKGRYKFGALNVSYISKKTYLDLTKKGE